MSAPNTIPTSASQATSKTNSFDTRRSSSTSSEGVAAEHKQAGFKGFAKKMITAAKEHHKSVRNAHKAYYGFP